MNRRINQKEKCKLFENWGKFGMAFAFMLMFGLSGWAQQQLTLDLNGVYLINDKQADPGTTNCRHLYPNGNYLRVDANLGKNRYWVVDYAETIDGVEYYRFKNRESNKYICVRDAENQPLETGALGTANYDSNRPNAFLFRLVRRSDEPYYVNVLPYDYNDPDSGYGWFNKNNNTSTNIGLRVMNDGGSLNQGDWKVLWNFEKVDERSVLTDPIIGGPTLITETGTYNYGGLTPTYKVYVGTTLFSSSTSSMSYVWTAEGLPNGTTFVSTGQKQLIVTSMPSEPTAVTLTCTASKTVDGVVYTSTYTHTVMISAPTHITSLNQLGASGYYILDNDIDDASGYTTIENFTGYFDGNFHTIKGLMKPLFGSMNSATVCNVVLDNIDINETGDAGAIARNAIGNSRIFNCGILATNSTDSNVSSTVSGTENVGGLVGKIDGYTHVVNCYSYANITGGSVKAGLVGYNSFSSTQDEIRTMVVNCMFYGDIDTNGGTVSPVFGGERIYNGLLADGTPGINTYDYFRESASFDESFQNVDEYYNCWPAEERHLTRFEYYRSILNSNRRLCVWWIIGQQYQYQLESDPDMVAKWVLDPSIAPYPILKPWGKYNSVINDDPEYVWSEEDKEWKSRESMPAYQGKKLGTLTVTVKAGANNSGAGDKILYLPILDMDTLHHDYCYAKVQLPYYNEQFGNPDATTHAEKYANNYTSKVVTGWKVTNVTGGTPGTFVEDWESGYNFADRYCTNKDLYSVSKRVFAQGGFYYVPEGVTAITIEAYWGNAVYLHNSSHYMDKVNAAADGFIPAGTTPTKFPAGTGATVYASIQSAIAALQSEGSGENALTVYDQAIVLVGNYQYMNGSTQNTFGYSTTGNVDFTARNKPFTVTSVDLDFDNEPDYCMELQYGSGTTRVNVHPIRFDFISVPNLGLAIRTNTFPLSCGIFMLRGHFEITETAFMHTTQFEYDSRSDYQKDEAPVIFNGGEFEQLCSTEKGDNTYNTRTEKTKYFILGGHAWMKEFTPGTHGNRTIRTRHCAVNVLGGEYGKLYLSGIFRSINNRPDNPHCYTNGGKFGIIAGAGMESVDGDVTFKIDHSIIGEFYGGGINSSQPVTGSINVTVNNSIVGKYCGGPKMGDMLPSTEVVTEANNTIFGQFYGGGNGGTNFNRNRLWDNTINGGNALNITPDDWNENGQFATFVPFTYVGLAEGYQAQFEFEHIQFASGSDDRQVARTYCHEAQFSATNVIKTTSTLTGCTVLQDFYGGGNLGAVLGDATSKLVNTTIWGSAFGGGFSATIPSFCVHDKSTVIYPYRDYAGNYHPGSIDYEMDGDEIRYYTWIDTIPTGMTGIGTGHPNFQYNGKWYCFTEKSLTDLGRVEGNTNLTIDGASKIFGQERPKEGEQGDLTFAGAAFGGGNEAKVYGNSTVNVGTYPEEQPMDSVQNMFVGNVYGGGKIATTGLNSTVNMYAGRVGVTDENGVPYPQSGRVFGGGKGSFEDRNAGQIGGNSTVLMKNGLVLSGVYGGSELGDVVGDASVTIENGTVGYRRTLQEILDSPSTCHVFGGGKGDPDVSFNTRTNVRNATVRILGGTILGSVYGGGEEGHVLGDIDLSVSGGNIGTFGYSGYDGNVFGGGRGLEVEALTAGSVGGNIDVNITGGNILGSVYGGCRSGSVGVYFTSVDDPNYGQMQPGDAHGYITVNVSGGVIGHDNVEEAPENIGGNVYGGCKGLVAAPEVNPLAERMANAKQTTVTISGTPFIRSSVFGGSEDGHILYNTYVYLNGGQIGGTEFGNLSDDGNSLHGNVYGGGRGLDRYYVEGDEQGHYCQTSGQVYGNAYLNITGGKICRNVYGGGNMSSVGQYEILVDNHGDPILDDDGNTQLALDDNGNPIPVSGTGLSKVIISGGEIGNQNDEGRMHGNVFGSSRGLAGTEFKELATVHNTDVTILGTGTIIKGSVFGGGENGHVNENTKVTVNNGTIGVTEGDAFKGNVYGGGRGIDLDPNGATSPTAGLVRGHTRVYINGGNIINSVYGGGNMSLVGEERVVNINGGLVKVNVFGGSKALPEGRVQLGMKTVNMRGGHVMGNVYGCNNNALDGDVDHPKDWTSFVNINGGQIDGNVFGAGYSCTVNGSVCVNIGKDAILNAPNKTYNLYYKDCGGDEPQYDPEGIEPTATKLVIGNSVYGGSDFYGNNANTKTWTDFIVSGYSNIYIDGTGYDTQNQGTNTEMTISGGLFGSSTHCESAAEGRHILLKAYGHRNDDGVTEFTHATRTLKTIQRCGNLVIDHSNVNFTGMNDISSTGRRHYSVFKVDSTLYMANASGFVLGSPSVSAYMDSIRNVRSVHLKEASYSVYDVPFYPMLDDEDHKYWEWIGIKGDTEEDAHLYYYTDLTGSNNPTALTFPQENVLIFKGDSRLWVRYHRKEMQDGKWVDMGQYYGELEGFFRMRSPFQPWGTESFAYARPKISEGNLDNICDGGFLSYNTPYNFFTDLGEAFTNTHQHPYTNVLQFFKGDRVDYREWVIREFRGRRWYVDGTRGWGRDDMSKTDGWGLYPDMPKKTVSGAVTYDQNTNTGNYGGICSEIFIDESLTQYNYDYQNDIIYVVGALSAEDESALVQGGTVEVEGEMQTYPLKLYRYPGGHPLNWARQHNNEAYYDKGDGTLNLSTTNEGLAYPNRVGPGANYGAMLDVQDNQTIALDNVQMDGLYGHVQGDDTYFLIPGAYYPNPDLEPYPSADPPIDPTTLEVPPFAQEEVAEPMIVTRSNSELTLQGSVMNGTGVTKFGTILERGYNKTNADVWYFDSDYADNGEVVHHGGGIYVNPTATVNVENFVTVTGNKQNLQIDSAPEAIECNVYLPTFDKHLNIIGNMALDEGTSIGVTSPIRNIAPHFVHNTFSPVAVALTSNQALSAWNNNNFHDDLNWFFSNKSYERPKYTYYSTTIPDYVYPLTNAGQHINHFDPTKTLFFGWTWNNVVRSAPQDFALNAIDSPYDLAWLISLVNGSNRQVSDDFANVTIEQTDDIDLQQYVWVPVGAQKTGASQFAGTYEGYGHLINNLDIAYIGEGDRRYERANYGLFGSVNNAVLNRTFVVSGFISPVGAANIGGLVGSMEGSSAMISNSEASVDIYSPDKENSENASGGLVGNMLDGEIHSSMAMPIFHANLYYAIGGLVGHTIGGGQGGTARKPKINNSFANVKFDVANNASATVGGLIGINYGADMENCYLHLQQNGDVGLNGSNFALLAGLNNGGKIRYSYAYDGNSYSFTKVTGGGSDVNVSDCYKYTPVITADELGYLYYDNVLTIGETKTAMFTKLNEWVTDDTYSKWARPTIPEINGDLPLLQLCNIGEEGTGAGGFRSLGTYKGGHPQLGAFPAADSDNQGVVLQYGGPVRDNENRVENELDAMVERMGKYGITDYLYVYGDINNEVTAAFDVAKIGKVSIFEDAAILHPNTMAGFRETYVGITFDNSCGQATSTAGINHLDGQLLPRDWHMFSSPITKAPLGFDYVVNGVNTNEAAYIGGDFGNYYNNPWLYIHNQVSNNTEYSWLNGGSLTGDNRYWMKTFDPAVQSTDGYFPTQRGALFSNGDEPLESEVENLFLVGSDECPAVGRYRYPYGMDLFCWYEPEPHWVNFKRNGPNHWHSDECDPVTHQHLHLPYTERNDEDTENVSNRNEDNLRVGKGYMASISMMTYLQSHGNLNATDKSRYVTATENEIPGWNLIGNPYHAYLDFDAFAGDNSSSVKPYYVIYNADGYSGNPESAYIYYPQDGSNGGEYADRYLHPHQGFFVKVENTCSLTFTEDMTVPRVTATNSAFRNWKPNYPLVNLYLSSENGCNDVTVVEFHRPSWGGAMKQKELRQGNGMFYAYHEGKPYAALFTKEGAERVPLWFEAKEDDVFTIKWNTNNGYFSSLYLIDNLTGIKYDMLENDSYVFEGRKQDYASRFYITFDCLDVEEQEEEIDQSFVFFDGSQWVVTGEGVLELIDLQGRILWQKKISGGQSRVSLPDVAKSMYLLRLVNTKETKIQKIIAE